MKRSLCLLICFVLVMLPACGEEPSATESSQPTETAEQLPAGDDTVYFRNPLEYDQLYSYDTVTGETALILPQSVYDVCSQGDMVYFSCSNGLYAMNPTDRSAKLIHAQAYAFCLAEGGVVYCVSQEEWYDNTLVYYDSAADTHTRISESAYASFAACDDTVYFFELQGEDVYDLYRYSIREKQGKRLKTGVHGSEMTACPSGVYFYNYDNHENPHTYVDGNTGKTTKLYTLLGKNISTLCMTENGLCYIEGISENGRWHYDVYCLSTDGTNTLLLQETHGPYPAGETDGKLLLFSTEFLNWGAEDEYGYGENTATRGNYYLLDKTGSAKPVQVMGESSELFSDGDFPLIDSSTARKPLTAALYSLFVLGYGYEGQEPICSTTHGAWLNIADRKADLAFLAAPTEEEKAYLAEKNVEVEMKLYGGDGLVFVANAENPVSNLTHEQIVGIYTGQITNWNEVGGPDHPITVYYRDPQSGSQRLFESPVFKGLDKPDYEALGFTIEEEMSSIVDMVAYDPWSVGYSIMTYLDSVYENEEVKILTVDGVTPSPETVADSTYRYHTKGYIVIRADEPEGSPVRRLFDWFGCPLSDALLESCSVTPLSE